jgi:D-alanyl-D-alanine dipeptidase
MKRVMVIIMAALLLISVGCAKPASPQPSNDTFVTVPTAEYAHPTAYVTAVPTEAPTEEPTPTPSPTPTPTPEPTPEPTPVPEVTATYKSRVNILNIRVAPDKESEVIGRLGFEETIGYIDEGENGFSRVMYKDRVCYCASNFLVPADEILYGYVSPMYEFKTDENGELVLDSNGDPIMLTAELIDIRLVIPDIEIYQIFGTDENFTGEQLYQRPVPVLQVRTAQKLKQAAERFAQDGYKIKLYDCYRPKSVQFILYDIVQNSAYIANPYKSASNHNRAAAVDITLIGPDGEELDFPSPMHTFSSIVFRSSRERWTEEQRANVDYMTEVMLESGFKLIETEWWHFSDVDYNDFIVLDIDMRDIPRFTASQLGY